MSKVKVNQYLADHPCETLVFEDAPWFLLKCSQHKDSFGIFHDCPLGDAFGYTSGRDDVCYSCLAVLPEGMRSLIALHNAGRYTFNEEVLTWYPHYGYGTVHNTGEAGATSQRHIGLPVRRTAGMLKHER